MKTNNVVCILAVSLVAIAFVVPAHSQAEEASKEKEELSIYGEVQAINASAGSMTVQYYDYDSDEEKPVEIVTDKDTKIENAASINDIKQGDWVDVAYSALGDKKIAKSVTLEKEEISPEEGAPEAPDAFEED